MYHVADYRSFYIMSASRGSSHYNPHYYEPWSSWDAYYWQDRYETCARAAHSQRGSLESTNCGSMASQVAVYADGSSAGIWTEQNPGASGIESTKVKRHMNDVILIKAPYYWLNVYV